MTLIEVATTIGDTLTQIDARLQAPGLSDSDWQNLYALRKHLDDQQRALVGKLISEQDDAYQKLTTQLKVASSLLTSEINDLTKVGNVIKTISQISSYADKILGLVK